MGAAEITALCTGIVAILGAAGSLLAVLRHSANPAKHPPGGPPGPGK